jgi:PilZ domain
MSINERRLGERVHIQLDGQLVLSNGRAVDITILDLSSSGARFQTPTNARLPNDFVTLRLPPDNREARAVFVRYFAKTASVRFMDDETFQNAIAPPAGKPRPRLSLTELRLLLPERTD